MAQHPNDDDLFRLLPVATVKQMIAQMETTSTASQAELKQARDEANRLSVDLSKQIVQIKRHLRKGVRSDKLASFQNSTDEFNQALQLVVICQEKARLHKDTLTGLHHLIVKLTNVPAAAAPVVEEPVIPQNE